MRSDLTTVQRERVRRLAEDATYGMLEPVDAVAFASDLLAAGVDSPALLALACMPSAPSLINLEESVPLVLSMAHELEVPLPDEDRRAWAYVRRASEWIVRDDRDPGLGATELWLLYEDCDRQPELAEMLQLEDEWEAAVGNDRRVAANRIVHLAARLIGIADLHLRPGG